MIQGDSEHWLRGEVDSASVDLIMTSPPFALVTKKAYGNADANDYCDWFRPFATEFKRVLKDSGSLVLDLGGVWDRGQPTRSLYQFKLLIMLVEEFGFHLAQEHYWWNITKLPAPAEWVNVRRVRVKDSVNTIWWLSKTPFPKACNKRVLTPYTKSMRAFLKKRYNAKNKLERYGTGTKDRMHNRHLARDSPSGHPITFKMGNYNGGAVPHNVLVTPTSDSNSEYISHCRERNITIHPARFPAQVPKYFIRFLTDPGDIVVDPFGGSCMTGFVAENLGRRWICCELSKEYLRGAKGRFVPMLQTLPDDLQTSYQFRPPCILPVDESKVPLVADGGRTRSEPD